MQQTQSTEIPTASSSQPEAPVQPPSTQTTPPSPLSPKSHKKLFIGFFGGIAFLILSSIAVLGYTYFSQKPEDVLLDAINKSSEAASVEASFVTPDGSMSLESVLHDGQEKYSKLSIKLDKIENEEGNNLAASLIFNSNDFYVQGTYSKLGEVISYLKTILPTIEDLETYKLLYPVLTSESWLYLSLPANEVSPISPTVTELDSEMETVYANFQKAIRVHRFEKNYRKNNVVYTRITLGFDKEKLVSAIDSLKDTDISLEVSQINAAIKFVQSIDNWDSDLVDILIDREGYVREVTLRMPQVPQKTLDELLDEGTKNQEELSFLKNFSGLVNDALEKKSPESLIDLGILNLNKYNEAAPVSQPSPIVSFEAVSEAATKELLPLFGAFLGGGMSPVENDGGLPVVPQNYSPTTPPSTFQNTLPTIVPGAPGSKEWEEDFWKRWNENGTKIDSLQQQVEESQKKFCEENPSLCN